MAILVDQAVWAWRGRRWAHLVSDHDYDELHRFAAGLGLPRRAFQGDHYDVPTDFRATAIEQGAEAVDCRELVRRLRLSGLRLSPAERRQLPAQVVPGPVLEGEMGPIGAEETGPPEEPRYHR